MARQTYVKFLTIKIFFGSLVWLFTKSVEQKTVHRPDLVSLWPVKPTSDFFLKIFRVSGLALYSQEQGDYDHQSVSDLTASRREFRNNP